MRFGVLCDTTNEGLDVVTTPYCETNNVTVRDIYDSSPNTKWNVLYELGDFWSQNEELRAQCADNINTTWFTGSKVDGDSVGEEMILGIVDGSMKLIRAGFRQYTLWMMISLCAIAVAVVGICLVARCVRNRYKRRDIMELFLSEYTEV